MRRRLPCRSMLSMKASARPRSLFVFWPDRTSLTCSSFTSTAAESPSPPYPRRRSGFAEICGTFFGAIVESARRAASQHQSWSGDSRRLEPPGWVWRRGARPLDSRQRTEIRVVEYAGVVSRVRPLLIVERAAESAGGHLEFQANSTQFPLSNITDDVPSTGAVAPGATQQATSQQVPGASTPTRLTPQ